MTGTSAKRATSSRSKSGMSATTRPQTICPSRKAGSSTHSAPASTRSSLMPSDPVARAPTMPAEIATLPPWQMIPIGRPRPCTVAHQVEDGRVAAHLVGRVAAGDDEPVERAGVEAVRRDVGPHRQAVLAAVGLGVRAHRHDRRALLLQAHDRDPVLEVLDALGDEDGVCASGEPHGPRLARTRLHRPQHRARRDADLAVAPQRLAVGLHRRGRVALDQQLAQDGAAAQGPGADRQVARRAPPAAPAATAPAGGGA